jgi:glycine/D-amino acid oxidase-like deaminating enzyme
MLMKVAVLIIFVLSPIYVYWLDALSANHHEELYLHLGTHRPFSRCRYLPCAASWGWFSGASPVSNWYGIHLHTSMHLTPVRYY